VPSELTSRIQSEEEYQSIDLRKPSVVDRVAELACTGFPIGCMKGSFSSAVSIFHICQNGLLSCCLQIIEQDLPEADLGRNSHSGFVS
jgi:hypothetical protein